MNAEEPTSQMQIPANQSTLQTPDITVQDQQPNTANQLPVQNEQPPKSKLPPFLFIGGVILLMIVIIATSIFYVLNTKSKPVNSNAVKPSNSLESSQWKTFKNDVGGYSFEYPLDWFVTQQNSTLDLAVVLSSIDLSKSTLEDKNIGIIIAIDFTNSTKTLDNELSDLKSKGYEGGIISSTESNQIDGEKAFIVRSSMPNIGKGIELLAKHGDHLLTIGTTVENNTNIDNIFEHIRTSFKFFTPGIVSSAAFQLKTKMDKYKGSDMFFDQGELSVYFNDKKEYPKDFLTMVDYFKSINKDTRHIYVNDLSGLPYQYQILNGGQDYQLSTVLDDGSKYNVYGSIQTTKSANDAYRLGDLSEISTNLSGYYEQNKKYPNKLSDLLPEWGVIVNGKPPAIIPKDPSGIDYSYFVLDNNTNYELSAILDIGLQVFYGGK